MQFSHGDYLLPNFKRYKEYLRYFNTIEDVRYLVKKRTKQTIVQLGYRSTEPILTSREFSQRRTWVIRATQGTNSGEAIFGTFLKGDDPVLEALKKREPLNAQKKISTIIFLKSYNRDGFETSGFIDFEQSVRQCNNRLKNAVDWKAVFEGKILLKPRGSDLSFCDVHKKMVKYNRSSNYDVLHDPTHGVMFQHRGDRKVIAIGGLPPKQFKDNCRRITIYSPNYGYVVLFDHTVRKKV